MLSPVWHFVVTATLWPALCASYVVPSARENTTAVAVSSLVERQSASESVSLSFVQRWAAVGDSFTAGIGSGRQMGSLFANKPDWDCSRWTYSWPRIIDRFIGSSRTSFQFPACSGARSWEIFDQVQGLQGNLDVVMLTAGGNDLCLAAMIRKCIILPYDGEGVCNQIIEKAQENIDAIFKPNIRQVLNALKPKMKDHGIVVYNSYAPFFNTDNEDCADTRKQQWSLPSFWSWDYWFGNGLRLTVDRRRKFNTLVENMNQAIRDIVKEFQDDQNRVYDIVFSDWSEWPAEVDGQFCSPRTSGRYPDPSQPELLFIKPDTRVDPNRIELKRRDVLEGVGPSEESVYDTLLYKSADPRAAAMHKLNPRAPVPPSCPGDGGWDPTLGLGIPDTFGSIFHPNQKGHEAIAAFALENLALAKARQGGQGADSCSITQDSFRCWSDDSSRTAFVRWETADQTYRTFCDDVVAPTDTLNWRFAKRYYEGTPEEIEFVVQLSKDASEFNKQECLESMDAIVNRCDGFGSSNPLNHKHGGQYSRGSYTYEINPWKQNRPFFTRIDGTCKGDYRVLWSVFDIEGTGWAGTDHGDALRNAAKSCVGGGLTYWKFEYYDNPADHNGMEWHASFVTPIWVALRCFDNLKVQRSVGGYTHRKRDNPADENYDVSGCAGNG